MNVSAEIKKAKTCMPEAWAAINGPIFNGVDRWGDYRLIYLEYAYTYAATKTREFFYAPQTQADKENFNELSLAWPVAKKHNYPFFFIAPNLFEAVEQTDLTFTVDWKKMPLPFPTFTFVLPRNQYNFQCIMVFRTKSPEGWRGLDRDGNYVDECFCIRGYYGVNGSSYRAVLAKPYEPDIFHSHSSEVQLENPTARKAMVRIVFNLLYAMASRPEYVECGSSLGRHRKSLREIRTPNIIGRKYAVKRDPNAEHGSHASPRMHWRRGHFRQQPYGTGLTEHKTIWLEPMLISAPKVDA